MIDRLAAVTCVGVLASASIVRAEPPSEIGDPAAPIAAARPATAPNFIIIMADDMGYGDSSVYDGWIKTPHLDRMAREGLVFTDFHSSGLVCSPTRAGLLTGRYQQRAGVPAVINADPKNASHTHGLDAREETFAELLRDAGYDTAIFGKWHLGYAPRHNPMHHGFDVFRGFISGNIDYISHYDRMGTYDWWDGTDTIEEPGYLTHLVTEHAVRFIDDHKVGPFCLYVPHGAVHTPIQGPDSAAGRGPDGAGRRPPPGQKEQRIRQMMQALDESVGAILDAVERNGVADHTIVLFFSDNGAAAHMRATPLRGRKGQVFEGGHRVPAIAWGPGRIAPGTRTDQLAISLDVMPTLLDLAGIAAPASRPLDGVSLAPLLLDAEPLGSRQLFWNGVAMRDGPWKLIARRADMRAGGPLLFNLDEDLPETTSIAADHPERVARMLAALETWKTDVAGAEPDARPEARPAPRADAARPNIVFVMADDLGYGDVGCYNAGSKIRTPNIDRLATQGMRFTDAHSPSAVCTPTRYGVLTGRYCWRTWLQANVVGGYTPPLIEPTRTTVASFLRSHGYRTGCFGKWHLGLGWVRANGFVGTAENAAAHMGGSWQDGNRARGMNVDFTQAIQGGPTALGFDEAFFTAACSTIDGPFCFIRNDRTVGIPDRMIPVDDYGGRDMRPRKGWMVEGFDLTMVDPAFTDAAIAFMERSRRDTPDRPFFVYLAFSSPHAPWLAPDFARGTTDAGPRGDLVAVADYCVGRIMRALDELGIADDTLVIFTSDNGPRIGANGHRSAGDLRGYKTHAWEGGHRVPFIARWPGRVMSGTTSCEPIELTDLLATSAAIIGRPLPDDAGPDSYDVLPALLGAPSSAAIREAIVSHSQAGVFAIRQGRWKLIVESEGSGGWVQPSGGGPKPGGPGQLYDLSADSAEEQDLFAERPEVVTRLTTLLERYRASGRSARGRNGPGPR